MAFRDTSIIWKVNICLQVSALIFSLAGFGSNYLVHYMYTYGVYEVHGGLWEICKYSGICPKTDDFLTVYNISGEWLTASKAMMVMSLVIHFLALLAMVGSVLLETSKMINWGLAVAEFTAAFLGIIGVAVSAGRLRQIFKDEFNITEDVSLGWSFILFLVSQFANIFIGLLHLLDARLMSQTKPSLRLQPSVSTINAVI